MDVTIQQGTKLEMRNSTFGFKWIFLSKSRPARYDITLTKIGFSCKKRGK